MRDEVLAWLHARHVEPSGAIAAVHERPWSTVLRVPTADGALFLKQCAPVQAFEVPLTAALAARWPDRMPRVVGSDERRAWLLLADGGRRLRDGGGLAPFGRALRLYAELQVQEAANVDAFLQLGVPDVRLRLLPAAYEAFITQEWGLERDEAARLRALSPRFVDLCERLEAFALPASIQHDDLHDGNVFVREGRVAILDWGDSSVAHPLFSWLKALTLAGSHRVDPGRWRDAYLEPWTTHAPLDALVAALELAVPVGTFAYALQYARQLGAMPPGAYATYAPYMAGQLRLLLARLAANRR